MRFTASFALLLCAGACCSWSQRERHQPPDSIKAPAAAGDPWPQTALNVLVLDRGKHPAPVTPAPALAVSEDGVPQAAPAVAGPDAPMSLGVVIDVSGSICPEQSRKPGSPCKSLNMVIDSVGALIKKLPADSEVMVITFNDYPKLEQPFSAASSFDAGALESSIKPDGGTMLYTAAAAAERYMASYARWKRRALILITDGDDNSSGITIEQTARMAAYPSCPLVYAVNTANAGRDESSYSELRRGEETLETLAQACGGEVFAAFSSKGKPLGIDELSAAVQSQVALNYNASNPVADGRRRKVEIRAQSADSNVQIRALGSYIPPSPQPAAGGSETTSGQAAASVSEAPRVAAWPKVTVNLLFEDKDGNGAANPLGMQVFEDGAVQKIESVAGPGTPMSVCLGIDLSGSMSRFGPDVRSAAVVLLRNLPRGSEAMVVVFRDNAAVALPFTPVNDINARAFDQLTFGHRTALYDSLMFAEENFVRSAHYPRRAMVLLTDAGENRSHHPESEVRRSLLMAGSPFVYVLQVNDPHAALDNAAYARNLLSAVRARFVLADTPTDLPRMAAELSHTIDMQYAFTYTSQVTARDRRLHKIEIKAAPGGDKHVKVDFLPGYYVPGS